ncbi:hypothetical protein BGY98DRAFT_1186437 [Russula aff. rugulosa BPL654]|nr:hypothetical protein BGY98DRAFT_1186437 [Russula aff. rugulosa BPL654]
MSFIVSQLTMIFLPFLALLLSCNVRAQATSTPPAAAIPLSVRSPYLNCWLQQNGNLPIFGQTWPTTINDSQVLGWSVLVRVDGLTYSFLGAVLPDLYNFTVNSTSIAITPTQTVVTARAGPMQVNLTFLNPIEPQDWVKQSIPFSYLAFTATSTDGQSHAVQVYSDVSGEWNSGDRSQKILWSSTSNADVIFHRVTLQTQTVFTEVIDQAEWGTLYYAMKAGENVTYQIAEDTLSRGNFTHNGVLNDQQDQNTRAIKELFAVFAISRDLGNVTATQAPVVWTVGYTTDPAINYTDQSRSLYYKTQYSNDEPLASIVDFLNDFSNASSRAQQLDNKILQNATSVTDGLGDLVSLAIAQVYGSMQLTIGTDAQGNFNNSDVMMYMKNIGGVTENRVNAVETLYAAFPALMYIDPGLADFSLSLYFDFKYLAAADLGSNYPSVSGGNSSSNQGVEQTGNMLIMTYAYARASGDGSLISRYYDLLTSWGDYLIASTLFIHDQSSADDLLVNNQTNLAIKGIIAIQAMSKMSSVVDQTVDANKYSNAAANLYAQWKSLALSSDQHLFAVYEQSDSWTLGYNLFADVWLGTNLVESSVYDGHSNFIKNIILTSDFKFGMPVDSISIDINVAVSSWSLFAAAMTTNQGLSSELITRVSNRASSTNISGVFPVYYSSADGSTLQGAASPAQGAVFAPLALKAPVLAINANGTTRAPTPHRKRNTGAIVGGIMGGAGAILVVIGIFAFVQFQRRRARTRRSGLLAKVTPFDPNSFEATQNSGVSTDQLPLGTEDPEAEIIPLHLLSSTPPTVLPRSRPVAPIPAGLTSKEIARLRAEALGSQQSHNRSTSNVSRSASSPITVTESSSGAASSYRRLVHTEVESLVRQEMERIRTEGLVLEAPPSYTEGDR